MVTADQLVRGATNYYEQEIARKAGGLSQFAAYFLLPSIPGKVKAIYDQYRDNPMLSDLITQDGLINIEEARNRARSAMEHCGSIELASFRLDKNDVESLYSYIVNA